jgi:hypothetical protein
MAPPVPGRAIEAVRAIGLERTVLINQRHPQFRLVTHAKPRPVVWDARLFGLP